MDRCCFLMEEAMLGLNNAAILSNKVGQDVLEPDSFFILKPKQVKTQWRIVNDETKYQK